MRTSGWSDQERSSETGSGNSSGGNKMGWGGSSWWEWELARGVGRVPQYWRVDVREHELERTELLREIFLVIATYYWPSLFLLETFYHGDQLCRKRWFLILVITQLSFSWCQVCTIDLRPKITESIGGRGVSSIHEYIGLPQKSMSDNVWVIIYNVHLQAAVPSENDGFFLVVLLIGYLGDFAWKTSWALGRFFLWLVLEPGI